MYVLIKKNMPRTYLGRHICRLKHIFPNKEQLIPCMYLYFGKNGNTCKYFKNDMECRNTKSVFIEYRLIERYINMFNAIDTYDLT